MCKTNVMATKVLKKFFIVAFSMVAFALLSSGFIIHAETSGKCGDDISWTLDDKEKKLTITGTGEMYDYEKSPWPDLWKCEVVISEGVTYIGNRSFFGCVLSKVTIPNTVTSIGEDAFHKCFLEQLTIPGSVINIGKGAFKHCGLLREITISEGVTSIGESAFESCGVNGRLTIPFSVTEIGKNAFRNCNSLEYLILPDTLCEVTDRKNLCSQTQNTCVCYVDGKGTTSAKIDEFNRYKPIWLSEDLDEEIAEYGMLDLELQFPIGSKFWVRWLSPEKNSDEWKERFENLDDSVKEKMKKENDLRIFTFGVTDPDGNEIKELKDLVQIFIPTCYWKDEDAARSEFDSIMSKDYPWQFNINPDGCLRITICKFK